MVPCRTVACYWCASFGSEEALSPFSGSSVSRTLHFAAFEAEDSPQQLWVGDEIQRGVEEEGRAQSHWGVEESSQGRSRCAAVEREGAGEGAMGTPTAVQSVNPATLKAGWPG